MTPAELRAWRTKRGITQTQLARLLGMQGTQVTISRWERGERQIPAMLPLALKWLEEEASRQNVRKER